MRSARPEWDALIDRLPKLPPISDERLQEILDDGAPPTEDDVPFTFRKRPARSS